MNKNVKKTMEEEFRDLPGYEGLYQVSNLGRVKSLGNNKTKKEKILNPSINAIGYFTVNLYSNYKKNIRVHQLVAMAFLDHIPNGCKLVIDHINDNPLDNRVENLQVVTQRYNAYKTQGKGTSIHKGVDWHKQTKKWRSRIYINNKHIHLGIFKTEEEASNAYQNKLKEVI